MATIPAFLLVHQVVARRYLGAGATGPTYAAGSTVACFVEDARRFVRDNTGRLVVSDTTLYHMPGDDQIPPESEVDVNGRTATVIVSRKRVSGLGTPDHWEVSLA